MTVGLVRTVWTGGTIGVGLTQHAIILQAGATWTDATAGVATQLVRQFWLSIQGGIPSTVTLQVQREVDTYDEVTGELNGAVAAGGLPIAVQGEGAGAYAGGVGMKIIWRTTVIRDGRRVRGATYVVPATAGNFDNTGTLTPAAVTTYTSAALAFLDDLVSESLALVVWSRPETVPGTDGALAAVTGAQVLDKSAVLRSRRD